MGNLTRADIEQEARRTVDAVADSPQGRRALRQAFYERQGGAHLAAHAGWGKSELAFLDWEIARGVLGGKPGTAPSPWWKAVNLDLCLWAELASLAKVNGLAGEAWPLPVRAWLEYLADSNGTSWYRAHNTSIALGYLAHWQLAQAEGEREQVFVNRVLSRVLYAQALATDATAWGRLGVVGANPKLPAVEVLTSIPNFYPTDYPIADPSWDRMTGAVDSLDEYGVHALDHGLIAPVMRRLYDWAAQFNGVAALASLAVARDGQVVGCYPWHTDPHTTAAAPKQRVVILGGGIAALAAAWELTRAEDWQNHYDITVHQLGWRLGGKMAGGRGPNGRVQELGLHLLLGFYVNAFPLFAAAYDERTKRGLAPDSPYRTLASALQPNNATLLVDWNATHGRWDNWPLIFPPSPGSPGDGPPLSTWQLLERGAAIVLQTILGSPYAERMNPLNQWLLRTFFANGDHVDPPVAAAPAADSWLGRARALAATAVHALTDPLVDAVEAKANAILQQIGAEFRGQVVHTPEFFLSLAKVVRHLVAELEADLVDADSEKARQIGHLLILLDFGAALVTGLFVDVYDANTGRFAYRKINDQDFRAWLRKHGANDTTLYSPMVTFFYTGTFEALADHNDDGGLLAAGTALQFAIPALGYKGSFCNQLRLGTADTLIMPLYQVLKDRGVKFEFFNKVKDLEIEPGSTGARRIGRIALERQVDLANGRAAYDPIQWVKGNPAWRMTPDWDQLDPAQAKQLQDGGIDLESPWSGWRGTPASLVRGKDFDHVILGIPAKALAAAAPSLLTADDNWRAMVANLCTAQVQSVQLWFDRSMAELGYDGAAWGMPPDDCLANVVTYANPMFSWLDQTPIIANEGWQTDPPKTLLMYTGILPDDPNPTYDASFPERMRERVRVVNRQWLNDNMGWFLKKATSRAYPTGIDFGLLRGTSGATDPRCKYDEQFFAAAVSPSDRYVIAVPGTEKYRLPPEGSGFANLWLVGDWTDYGTNIGYMEGCVVSAYRAVRALRNATGCGGAPGNFWRDMLADW